MDGFYAPMAGNVTTPMFDTEDFPPESEREIEIPSKWDRPYHSLDEAQIVERLADGEDPHGLAEELTWKKLERERDADQRAEAERAATAAWKYELRREARETVRDLNDGARKARRGLKTVGWKSLATAAYAIPLVVLSLWAAFLADRTDGVVLFTLLVVPQLSWSFGMYAGARVLQLRDRARQDASLDPDDHLLLGRFRRDMAFAQTLEDQRIIWFFRSALGLCTSIGVAISASVDHAAEPWHYLWVAVPWAFASLIGVLIRSDL